ncbi:MAG TPA: hypothetical protein PKY81_05745 [bacterium]|nr:hypothetical protein [bacterium]HPN30441.1 hypothetical protein [bacterium]
MKTVKPHFMFFFIVTFFLIGFDDFSYAVKLGSVIEKNGFAEFRNNDGLEWIKLYSDLEVDSGGLFATYKKSGIIFRTFNNVLLNAGENTVFLLGINDNEIVCKLISGCLQIENLSETSFTVLTTLSTTAIFKSGKIEIHSALDLNLINILRPQVFIKDHGKQKDYEKFTANSACLILDGNENRTFDSTLTLKNAFDVAAKYFSDNDKKNNGKTGAMTVKFENLDLTPSAKNSFEFKIITDKSNIVAVNNLNLKYSLNGFNFQTFLNEGKNNISIKIVSPITLETFNYDFIKILDSTPPKLVITRMNFDSGDRLSIEGLTEPGAKVKFGNIPITANRDGSFRTVISNLLQFSGTGMPDIIAEDEAGNRNVHKSNIAELNDMTPPSLTSAAIQPNTAKKNGVLMILISASDNTALAPSCYIKIKQPSGASVMKSLRLQGKNLYSGSLTGNLSAFPGTYIIEEIHLNDIYNNSKIYYADNQYIITE